MAQRRHDSPGCVAILAFSTPLKSTYQLHVSSFSSTILLQFLIFSPLHSALQHFSIIRLLLKKGPPSHGTSPSPTDAKMSVCGIHYIFSGYNEYIYIFVLHILELKDIQERQLSSANVLTFCLKTMVKHCPSY